eukprot:406128-Rhodomonas_salina.3
MARNSVNGCPLDQLVSTSPKSAPPHGFNRSKKRLSGIYLVAIPSRPGSFLPDFPCADTTLAAARRPSSR